MRKETLDLLRQLARRAGDVGVMARAALALEGERALSEEEALLQTTLPIVDAPRRRSTDTAPMTPAERAARYRGRHAGVTKLVTGVTDSVTETVTASVTFRDESSRSVTPLSLSSSSESAEKAERESDSSLGTRETVTSRVTEPVTGVTSRETSRHASREWRHGVEPVGERYVLRTDPINEELFATADMAQVQDIEGAWLKFCGHYADKWVHVAGKWQAWCVREAKSERTERDRQAQRGKDSAAPLTAEGLDPNSYEASQLRKKRRKAEEEAERLELRARLEREHAQKAATT